MRIEDANTADAARFRIEVEAVHNPVRANGEATGFLRGGQRGIQAAEIGLRDAAAMTNTAIVAGGAAFMDASEDRRAADGHDATVKMFGERIFEIQFDAGHFHGRKELAVGELRQAFGLAADASKFLDVVIPGSNVGITDRPIHGDAVFQVGFEIEIAPAIALAAPSDGFSANLAAANPGKMLAGLEGIGILLIVDENLVGVFATSIVDLALNGLSALAGEAIIPVTMLEFPNGNVLDVVALGNNGAAGLQHQGVETFFGEFLGGPAASDSGTHNDCVVVWRRHGFPLKVRITKAGA